MNIIKLVKCYDFFNGKVTNLVNQYCKMESVDIRSELKNSCLADLYANYKIAVNSNNNNTDKLQFLGNKIGLDIKDQKQLFNFLKKYNPILLPSDNGEDICHVLNKNYNKLLNKNMAELDKENLSGEGLITRRITVICSSVESVYGNEIEKLNTNFKLDNYVLKAGCSLKNNTANKSPKTNLVRTSRRVKDLHNDGK